MKMYKRLLIWAMLSVIIQATGLLITEKVVFKHSAKFELEDIDPTQVKEDVIVSLNSNVKDIKISSSGRYILYKENEKYMVKDVKNSESKEIVTENKGEILYIDWIQDTNNLMIAEKVNSDSGGKVINLIAYFANSGKENAIKEICTYQNGMQVDSVVSSVTTGTNYVVVSRGGYNPSIYRININEKLTKVSSNILTLGSIKAFPNKECIVYEDQISKKFYTALKDTSTKINFTNSQNLVLLAVDNEDNIYMGELDGDKIGKIIYGKDSDNPSNWATVQLDKPQKKEDIYVSKKSEIYVNNNLEGKIKNLSTGETVSYKGKFTQVINKSVCSLRDDKIYIRDLGAVDKLEDNLNK